MESEELSFFRKKMKDNKIKITSQRRLIYSILKNSKSHPTADEVFQILHQTNPEISFNTVFTNLRLFVKIGLIHETENFKNAQRYDAVIKEHGHFHCSQCGKIIDFDLDSVFLKIPEKLLKNFKIKHQKIILSGFCANCYKQ